MQINKQTTTFVWVSKFKITLFYLIDIDINFHKHNSIVKILINLRIQITISKKVVMIFISN